MTMPTVGKGDSPPLSIGSSDDFCPLCACLTQWKTVTEKKQTYKVCLRNSNHRFLIIHKIIEKES